MFIEPWLVWFSGLSASLWTKGLPVQFPVRAHAWLWARSPDGGVWEATTHWCFSPSLPLPLKINTSLKMFIEYFPRYLSIVFLICKVSVILQLPKKKEENVRLKYKYRAIYNLFYISNSIKTFIWILLLHVLKMTNPK